MLLAVLIIQVAAAFATLMLVSRVKENERAAEIQLARVAAITQAQLDARDLQDEMCIACKASTARAVAFVRSQQGPDAPPSEFDEGVLETQVELRDHG